MNAGDSTDWNPGAYARFRGLRLRPALDLLAQVGPLPGGDVVDLGCGDGAVAGALRLRFPAPRKGPARRLIGVDSSSAMLAEARGYDAKVLADIAGWTPDAAPALIFANAALHWLPDHAKLIPALAKMLAAGGVLAVQMPRQFMAASHALARQIAQNMFPDRHDYTAYAVPVHSPERYAAILQPLGQFQIWETEYLQVLPANDQEHPVRSFTQSTALGPILATLAAPERLRFLAAYDDALGQQYPRAVDRSVLFPFRRLFFTLERP